MGINERQAYLKAIRARFGRAGKKAKGKVPRRIRSKISVGLTNVPLLNS